MTGVKTFLSVGECMIEMALLADGGYRLGYAGDTLNTAWYARAALPRQSWRVSYFTRLGKDPYSVKMRGFFESNGIDTSFISTDPVRLPGLYLIDIQNGERSFTYWRDQSAAKFLAADEAHLEEALNEADIIYFSGVTLAILTEKQRALFLEKVGSERRRGKRTVFDPNARPRLWDSLEVLRDFTMKAATVCELVLPSFDDEAGIFGDRDVEATAARYLAAGCGMAVVKNGGGPMVVSDRSQTIRVSRLEKLQAVDTTGAGDSFNGSFLAALVEGLDVENALMRAHRVASRVIMHRGALLPMNEIADLSGAF